ncbi:MAG: hypothetical protein WC549_00485 [Actinomycetota bacterium]
MQLDAYKKKSRFFEVTCKTYLPEPYSQVFVISTYSWKSAVTNAVKLFSIDKKIKFKPRLHYFINVKPRNANVWDIDLKNIAVDSKQVRQKLKSNVVQRKKTTGELVVDSLNIM